MYFCALGDCLVVLPCLYKALGIVLLYSCTAAQTIMQPLPCFTVGIMLHCRYTRLKNKTKNQTKKKNPPNVTLRILFKRSLKVSPQKNVKENWDGLL